MKAQWKSSCTRSTYTYIYTHTHTNAHKHKHTHTHTYSLCESGNLLLLFENYNQVTVAINNVGRNFFSVWSYQSFYNWLVLNYRRQHSQDHISFQSTKDKQSEEAGISAAAEWGVMGQQQMSGTEFHGTVGRQQQQDSGRDRLLEQKPKSTFFFKEW